MAPALSHEHPRRRPRLRRLLAWQFAGVALAPLAVFVLLWAAFSLPEAWRAAERENARLAGAVRDRILGLLAVPQRSLQLAAALADGGVAGCGTALLGPVLAPTPEFESVYCTDAEGIVRAAVVREGAALRAADLLGLDMSRRPFFAAARRSERTTWSDTFLSPLTGRVTAVLALPVGGGLLVGELALDGLARELSTQAEASGASLILLDARGRVIVHPQQHLADWQDSFSHHALVRAALDGRPGSGAIELDGAPWLASISRAPASDWFVLVARPQAQLYQELRRLAALALAALALALAVALWAALRRAGREAARYRRLVDLAGAIAAGRPAEAGGDLDSEEIHALWQELRALVDRLQEQERQAKSAQAELQAVLDAATEVAVMAVDGQGRLRLFNRGAERMLGHAAAQALGREPAAVLGLEMGQLWALASAGQGETLLRCADSRRLPVTLVVTALGEGLLAIALDQSQRERAAAQELARRGAEAASRAKSEFLSRVSHELRTPMNAILGYAQLLQLGPLAPAQQEQLRRIVTAGWHLVHLIDDVLDLSRIESGQLQVRSQALDLAAAAAEALRLVAPQAAAAGVALQGLAPQPAPLLVQADPTRLQQVLLNLLSNAIKYNRPGGRVWLTLEPAPPQEGLRLAVHDNGLGLDAQQRARLFRPFDRLGREAGAQPGTGIGLVICQRLLALMGGTLELADSRPGAGSVFVLGLPAAQPQAAAAPTLPAGPPDAVAGPAGELLYVEDNPVNAGLMRELLALRPGLGLRLADTLAQGRVLLAQRRPALLLLDMHLPDGSALELLGWLREQPALAGMPVLVVSADATEASRRAALAAGASAYLHKPLELARLLATLDALLSPARPA
jgi:signal transduction histidine kinase/CheY-like chemotaxis protein